MRRPLSFFAIVFFIAVGSACAAVGSADGVDTAAGHVTDVLGSGDRAPQTAAAPQPYERVRVQLDDTLYRGDTIDLEWSGRRGLDENGFLRPGDHVILGVARQGNDRTYTIVEIVRLPTLWPLAAIVVLALLAVARYRGLAAIAAVAASVGVVLIALVPAVQRGGDPIGPTLVGSVIAAIVCVVIAHGRARASVAAACGAVSALGVVTACAAMSLAGARLTGLGAETQTLLATGAAGAVDPPRLVVAGVLVASLGLIVDVCVAQASATTALAASPDAPRGMRLFASAVTSRNDHVVALVAAAAFAYIGASLPVVLLVSLGADPLFIRANSEELTTLLVAIGAAILGLVWSVPATTAAAVMLAERASPVAEP